MTSAALSKKLVRSFAEQGLTVGTAESCTGGLIAKRITDVPGSSAVLLGGLVTYTNEVKTALLGVPASLIERETEVSHACACAMAVGARERLGADLAVSTTGFAGPGGGNERDPVGTVYIAVATRKGVVGERFSAPENATRRGVREAAAARALALLLSVAETLSKTKHT